MFEVKHLVANKGFFCIVLYKRSAHKMFCGRLKTPESKKLQ